MVRNILPLASLTLSLLAVPAFAADQALVERITAAAEKACPLQVYEGSGLFYPISYKAEHANCVRLVTRSVVSKIEAERAAQIAQN